MVVFVVALIVLGPDKMPEAMRKGARLLGEARQWSARISEELQSAVSLQAQDLSAPTAETPATLADAGGLGLAPPPPGPLAAAPAPSDDRSSPSASGPAEVEPKPPSALPAGYLPLVPKESS